MKYFLFLFCFLFISCSKVPLDDPNTGKEEIPLSGPVRAVLGEIRYPLNMSIFNFLLDRKPPLNLQDNEGNTSLHYAVKSGNLEAVKILLQAGADSKIKNKRNYTPLDFSQDLVPELRQKMQKIIKP